MRDELRSLQGKGARAFGIDPVEADHHADPPHGKVEHGETEVARREEKILPRVEVNLTVQSLEPAGSGDRGGVVQVVPCPFSEAVHNVTAAPPRVIHKCGECFALRVLAERERLMLVDKIIPGVEQLGKYVEIGGSALHEPERFGDICRGLAEHRPGLNNRNTHKSDEEITNYGEYLFLIFKCTIFLVQLTVHRFLIPKGIISRKRGEIRCREPLMYR